MIVIGFVIFALAVAAAIVAIAQNQTAMVQVHVLGYTWNVHAYGILIVGLVIAAVGLIGLAMMRSGAAHSARIRAQRRGLVRENARLNDLAADRSNERVVPATQVIPADRGAVASAPVAYSGVPVTAGPTNAAAPVAYGATDATAPVAYDAGAPASYETTTAPRHRQFFHRTRQV